MTLYKKGDKYGAAKDDINHSVAQIGAGFLAQVQNQVTPAQGDFIIDKVEYLFKINAGENIVTVTLKKITKTVPVPTPTPTPTHESTVTTNPSEGTGSGVSVFGSTTVDKNELHSRIQDQEVESELASANNASNAVKDALSAALAQAKRVSADANATQEQVDVAVRKHCQCSQGFCQCCTTWWRCCCQ